jgi:hypothetical protein
MLLELRQLSQSLLAANVTASSRDDHLVAYSSSKPLFRVSLTEAGEVRSLEPVEKSKLTELLKYRVSSGGDQESVPGFTDRCAMKETFFGVK